MPLPVIPQCFRVAIEWVADGSPANAVNVMHITAGTSTPQEVYDILNGAWNASMTLTMSSSAVMNNVVITPLDGESMTGEFPGFDAPIGVSSAFIPSTAAIIKATTVKRGRSFRGRTFLPFTAESQVTNGRIELVVSDLVDAAWETFKDDVITAGGEMVVASYLLAEANSITRYRCEQLVGTQRRRQDRLRNG